MRKITSRQLKAALAMLGWKVSDLAEASGVSEPTIWRLETAEGEVGGRPATTEKLVDALETAGIIFLDGNGEGPGVRLRKIPWSRKPASAPAEPSKPAARKTAPAKKMRPRRS
jgi:transcriptional regulator with XRE-family HTH domain